MRFENDRAERVWRLNDRIKTIAVLLDAAERSLRQYGDACGRKSRVAMYQQELDSLRKAQAINS